MKKDLRLRYKKEAPNSLEGWERDSLPIGNGRFGASVFGGIKKERLQITTNEFANDYERGGVSNFMEIHLEFATDDTSDYERGLRLQDGVVYSFFHNNGSLITRECFYSYPDKVLIYHISSAKPLSFKVNLIIPYLNARSEEDGGRRGEVFLDGEYLRAHGELPFRDLVFDALLSVSTDGAIIKGDGNLNINGCKEATLLFTSGTSYSLCPEVFFKEKALGEDPSKQVKGDMEKARSFAYQELYLRHKTDYQSLMGRVDFRLNEDDGHYYVPDLLSSYKRGEEVPYLEELYFFFGRHLLISSSRKGSLPASLQGVWSAHDKAPWGSGFWHNINVQMNYWPAFSANLAETFDAYASFFEAYLPKAQENAQTWAKAAIGKNIDEDAWIIGTGAFAYEVEGLSPNTHSGPGTGGMTAQLFMDAYEFTQDERLLEGVAWKAIHGMAAFLICSVKEYDGAYLCSYSASPEQILSGHWENGAIKQQYYHTVGCAFDEQWLEQNARNDLKLASLLGIEDQTTAKEKRQIGHYCPVEIGYSGQIKEYGEERFYGEIGEYHHRHISQLVGLMPGNIITHKTPAWLDAARHTLELRGDESTGWALAHRLCAYARTSDGDHAYELLRVLLEKKTHPNLLDVHPPFQIDGNFGALAGMVEMLIQSHEGYISLLPSLPKRWRSVSFEGLKARGNFEVSLSYMEGHITFLEVKSLSGRELKVFYPGFSSETKVYDIDKEIKVHIDDRFIQLATEKGHSYRFEGIAKMERKGVPTAFKAEYRPEGVLLSWISEEPVVLFRAVGNECGYQELGVFKEERTFLDKEFSSSRLGRVTYKLIDASKGYSEADEGALCFLHPASKLEEERYKLKLAVNNLIGEKIGWDFGD